MREAVREGESKNGTLKMSKATRIATLMAVFSAFSSPAKAQAPPKIKPSTRSAQPTYMITAHTVVHDDSTNSQLDNYVIVYGSEILRVQYAESQLSTVKPGASELEQVAPGKNLHLHMRYSSWPQGPDVSQVPHIGVPIRACEMDTKYPDNDGHPVIAIQSVSAPCMSRDGDTLHYAIAPNGGIKMWEYVNFDILEVTNNVGVVAAQAAPPRKDIPAIDLYASIAQPLPPQSAPPRKDIPAIAKAANGAIVSIIMSDKDGHAIAQGSGFLISNDGVILTNYHVIAEGSSAVVKLPDGAIYVVDGVLASDKARDIAVIKAHGQNFRTLPLGNSDRVQVGEEVVPIGNPLSLESTVSNGIVSGIRAVEEEGGKYLQITAPISPGSSGGPLFNMAGEVIGITSMYLKGGENLNFAIPINDVKPITQSVSFKTVSPFLDEKTAEKPAEKPAEKSVEKPAVVQDFLDLYNAGGVSPGFDHVCLSVDNKRFFLMTISEMSILNQMTHGQVHTVFYQDGVRDKSETFMWNAATNAWEAEMGMQQTYIGVGTAHGVVKEYYELSIEQATGRFKILLRQTSLVHSPGTPDWYTEETGDIGYKGVCNSIALEIGQSR
jgi:S1-C subfamily serine protease